MFETFLLPVSFAAATAALILGLFLISLMSRNLEVAERRLPVALVFISGMLLLASGLLHPRNLRFASLGANFIQVETSSAYLLLSRISNSLLVIISLSYLVLKLIDTKQKSDNRIALPILVIFIFGISNFMLPIFLGAKHGIDHRLLYSIVFMAVLFSSTSSGVNPTLNALKVFLFAFLAISLLFILIDSSRVLAPSYRGFIPGVNSRFWGLAPHSNAIGPMAAQLVFLELLVKARSRVIRCSVFLVAATVLVLAQSKTAIFATIAGLIIIWYMRLRHDNGDSRGRLHWRHLAVISIVTALSASILMISMLGQLDGLIAKMSGRDITTLTGRNVIWEAAYREFLNNPTFGYGMTLWDEAYRMKIGLNYAYHAHNQFLQTLAESGIAGLSGLLMFLGLTLSACLRTSRETQGVSLAIFLLLLFRCVTEVPLRPFGIGTGEMFLIATLMCIWRIAYPAASGTGKLGIGESKQCVFL